jgi:hypothetical protein
MSFINSLVVGKQMVPPRIVIYGGHGIGKSTLASKFPSPIFINTEGGLDSLDVTSFPRAETINEVVDSIKVLLKDDHDFKTVIIDSVDWLVEPLITKDVEESHDAKDLAFGKGQVMIAESFREVLQGLEMLRRKKNMNVVLLAHASIVRYESPMHEPYDKFTVKLPNRANAILQEWADVIAYAAFKIIIKKADVGFNNQVARGITTGERLLHVTENPAYIAKNRYGMPDVIDMSFEELAKYLPISE